MKAPLWKRLTAFLFEHQWNAVGVRVIEGELTTAMQCERCRKMVEYPTIDRPAFHAIYRMRGCPRHIDHSGAKP